MSEQVKNKMLQFEVTPPAGVWDRIVSDLDQSDLGAAYRSKLASFTVAPPAGTWKKIESQLPVAAQKPAGRIVPWVRYAAAAVLLAALAWGGSLVLNRNKDGNEIEVAETGKSVTPPVTPPVADDIQKDPAPATDEIAKAEQDARDEAALEQSKRTYAKLTPPKRNKIRNAAGFRFSLDVPEPVVSAEEMDPANRYIVLMTPDGHYIRMSKKWSELVCCVAGEEQDAECVDQLKKWREKLAHSSQTASPGNFGDILDLVKNLQND